MSSLPSVRSTACNAATATALIDRLVHHAEILTLEGDSYRRRVAEARKTPKPPPPA